MDRQTLIDEFRDAMDNFNDMDVTLSDFARAAVNCLGWRELANEKPEEGDMVIATDGKARWMDMWFSSILQMCWNGKHVATHWHPVLDLPAIIPAKE